MSLLLSSSLRHDDSYQHNHATKYLNYNKDFTKNNPSKIAAIGGSVIPMMLAPGPPMCLIE
jgi:hypothetical protein